MRERIFGLICTVGGYYLPLARPNLIISRYLALSSAREVQPYDDCLIRKLEATEGWRRVVAGS